MHTSTHAEVEEAASAIEALGHLFKLSEIYLWADAAVDVRGGLFPQLDKEIRFDNVGSNNSFALNELLNLPEDLELARQMNDLGLPISFHTNKEKQTAQVKGRKKDLNKDPCRHTKIKDEMLELSRLTEGENASGVLFDAEESSTLCPISTLGQCALSGSDISAMTNISSHLSDGENACSALTEEITDLGLDDGFIRDSGFAKGLFGKDGEMYPNLDDDGSSESCLLEGRKGHGRKGLGGKQMDYAGIEASIRAEDEAEGETWLNDISGEPIPKDPQVAELVHSDTLSSNTLGVSGDWSAYWDHYYMRTYFYNIRTQESTWVPPPGMEGITFSNAASDLSLTELIVDTEESNVCHEDTSESNGLGISYVPQYHVELTSDFNNENKTFEQLLNESRESDLFADSSCNMSNRKKKKKTRRLKSYGKLFFANEGSQLEAILEEITPSIMKYWCQRYLLFSRFDQGIRMDEEGWFSVTPEPIAIHHASRCGSGITIDCFTGVGGNAIQFARRSKHVIAIDIDPRKIDYAQHNAAIYGVEDKIDFVRGDCFLLAPHLKADTVFLSPPWGGPDYAKVKRFDVNSMLWPHDGHFLFQIAKRIAPKVVMFLPRNVDVNQLAELALSASPPWALEVEKNYLNGKLKAVTAYFSEPSA